jgi:dTDP-4-amino-4,6-dideoxygalactose transaminase
MILANDFKAEPMEIRVAMLNAVDRVINSGLYVLGNEVKLFEQAWAVRCGVGYAVGTGNGMDAIEIGLRALSIGPGDEVITTSMTAFATVLAIIRAGATPVLADIDANTALIDIESAKRCISPATKAIILVHLYGQIEDIAPWLALCSESSISLIEDCAQSHLAQWGGKTAGSFGRFGAYSFYPTKNLGAVGDAGMLVTNDEPLAHKASSIRNYGQSVRYHHPETGLNSRLDESHAAMLSERLKWLDEFTLRRRAVASAYRTGISNPNVQLMRALGDYSSHVYHLFVVRCKQRDALLAHLNNAGVQSLIHYPVPIHFQLTCREMARDPHGLASSETHAQTCLSLPCHPYLSTMDVQTVIQSVNSFPGN